MISMGLLRCFHVLGHGHWTTGTGYYVSRSLDPFERSPSEHEVTPARLSLRRQPRVFHRLLLLLLLLDRQWCSILLLHVHLREVRHHSSPSVHHWSAGVHDCRRSVGVLLLGVFVSILQLLRHANAIHIDSRTQPFLGQRTQLGRLCNDAHLGGDSVDHHPDRLVQSHFRHGSSTREIRHAHPGLRHALASDRRGKKMVHSKVSEQLHRQDRLVTSLGHRLSMKHFSLSLSLTREALRIAINDFRFAPRCWWRKANHSVSSLRPSERLPDALSVSCELSSLAEMMLFVHLHTTKARKRVVYLRDNRLFS